MTKVQKEFRTEEQFVTISENALNGNWKDAAQNCVDFGFFANDLIKFNKIFELFDDHYDLAELAEMACKIRYNK